jgi:hypothetical protein
MSRDFITEWRPFDPGLVIHHDVRNERWLYTDTQPKRVARSLGEPAEVPVKTKNHHAYVRVDQIGDSCTGYAPVTLAGTAHEYNVSPISGTEWYARNREKDQAQGLTFPAGATVTSSMETGRDADVGLWEHYRWIYDTPNMERAVQTRALIAATNWYPSMFSRDREGIVKMPAAGEQPVGGHEYSIGGWDKRRGLWRVDQTWVPIGEEVKMPYKGWVYYIPAELMARLVREEGEIAVPDEVKLPRKRAA